MDKLKVILSGGGTGGHIYPAVAVAEQLQREYGDRCEILFVGAEGRMEMEKIPALGYRIEGLPVSGIQRRNLLKNFAVPYRVMKSVARAKKIIRQFSPDIVIGFGGYASAPILWAAQRMKVPTIVQEQNSFAGVANRILGKRATRVCVAYEGMERFFKPEKTVLTGNPLRGSFGSGDEKKAEGFAYFGLDPDKETILITGGSLGTRTLNRSVLKYIDTLSDDNVQLIWQTGRYYKSDVDGKLEGKILEGIWHGAFIDRMDLAYAVADVVIARAGACTVSELALMGKAAIFVPSPNVSEDHQTKNAVTLVSKKAALVVPDKEAEDKVVPAALSLIRNKELKESMAQNIRQFGVPDSAERIVRIITEIIS